MQDTKTFPCVASITAIFASICIAVFSMLSCYYAKTEYDNSKLIAEKVAQKYHNAESNIDKQSERRCTIGKQ